MEDGSSGLFLNSPQRYLLNNLGRATHRPEGLSGSTRFFEETFGTFPLLFEMIPTKDTTPALAGGARESTKV
jgi:hypothetical protein